MFPHRVETMTCPNLSWSRLRAKESRGVRVVGVRVSLAVFVEVGHTTSFGTKRCHRLPVHHSGHESDSWQEGFGAEACQDRPCQTALRPAYTYDICDPCRVHYLQKMRQIRRSDAHQEVASRQDHSVESRHSR